VDAELLSTLENQHREAEELLAQLEGATESAEQRPLVERLTTALSEHMAIEEEQVYPELERIDGEMAEEANVEHGLAREGLSKLQEMIGEPGFGAAVEMVKGGIAHHVKDEEEEAFPKLREALGLGGGSGSSASDGPTKQELYDKAKEAGVEGRSSMTKDELAEAVGEQG
jgi:iron-sulfur cluster repair protein YtfE (RIC family)